MEDIDASSLEVAKSSFLSLLSKVDPCESASFVEWVIQHCSNVNTNGNTGEMANYASMTSTEKRLTEIVKDIKKRVPLRGIMASENISHPEEGENSEFQPSTTVHVDSFLYSDEDIDRLCDEGKMSRNYCKDCGSHNTAPLTFISHSSSLVQLRFIFQEALPMILNTLSNKLLLDVGSRLGAVLYGAYHFSTIQKIVGVEINADLCNLQQEIIEKYNMTDRVEIRCADICSELALLKQADVVVLNNVFEFFLPVDEQIRTWKILREHLTKPGCVLVTVPSLEEATIFNNEEYLTACSTPVTAIHKNFSLKWRWLAVDISEPRSSEACIDLNSWVKPCTVNYNVAEICSCDEDSYELQNIFFYQVM